jgi:hypothetical protein
MAGPNGSVLENFNDFEMDDIDENDNENEDDGTINGLLLSRNKQMKRSNSGTSRVVIHNNNQQNLLTRDKIAPIVYFKVDNAMKDPIKLNNYLKDKVKDVRVINVRFSNNGNVSVYTSSSEDNLKLEQNDDLFNGLSKLNLDSLDKSPCLMVKNINYEFAIENEQLLKDKYDVKEIIKVISKQDNDKSIKMVKLLFHNEGAKNNVLKIGSMLIGYFKFYVEEYSKPPIQCKKCKGFGHIGIKCVSKYKCGFCGDEHDEKDCKIRDIKPAFKCANCSSNHSAYYRGCSVYKQAKDSKLQNVNKSFKVNTQNDFFQRNYSTYANKMNSSNNDVMKMLDEMKKV